MHCQQFSQLICAFNAARQKAEEGSLSAQFAAVLKSHHGKKVRDFLAAIELVDNAESGFGIVEALQDLTALHEILKCSGASPGLTAMDDMLKFSALRNPAVVALHHLVKFDAIAISNRLEKAVTDSGAFEELYAQISRRPLADIKAVAKEFFGKSGTSKKTALQNIRTRRNDLTDTLQRRESRAGRTAA